MTRCKFEDPAVVIDQLWVIQSRLLDWGLANKVDKKTLYMLSEDFVHMLHHLDPEDGLECPLG